MTHPSGTRPAFRRTPLNAEERARSEIAFSQLVTHHLTTQGRFRITADTPEMVDLWQTVARRVGETLRRPVVSYANGRDIVITFAQEAAEAPGLTPQA
ncbi:hypothetical protein [Microbispora hainanensis]|uniref:Uncharacterized protein n=1 Tax=Microbispora hainanensis TaxID=568844 RepID=A0A544YLM8_9ACTN|nr:hypothetical protein [Microbispora hainanensis]TQS17698.1 hypothetical protein FLX08_28170 [Microbispora hainanensis]